MNKNLQGFLCLAVLAGFAVSPVTAGDSWYGGAAASSGGVSQPPSPPPRPEQQSLKCSPCYGSLSGRYTPSTAGGLRSLNRGMTAPPGYTGQEARNYFEAVGKFLSAAGLDAGEEAQKQEKKQLLAIVREGKYYYGSVIANVGTGAADCLTHASRLKEYLEERFSDADYKFEIVNGWSDPAKYSAANVLGANHYMVRAVSMRTGHSYVCDGYVVSSVKSEKDSSWILFNDFEDCVYGRYSALTLGEGALRVIAQWTPVQKGLLAQRSKSGAGVYLSGAEFWTFEQ